MKTRILALAATAGLGLVSASSNAQELETSVTAGIESEYVFRGIELAGDSFQGSIDLSYGDAYFSVWTNQPLKDESDSEIDFVGGYQYLLNEKITLDAGATVYYYPDADGAYDSDTTEFFFGVAAHTYLDPKLYVYYDVDLDTFTTEASASKAFKLTEKAALEVGAALGWVKEEHATDYFYYGATADVVYNFTDTMRASLGLRSAGNDDGRGPMGKENNAWTGFSFSASF